MATDDQPTLDPRFVCERCGGTGQVIAVFWNPATAKYDSPAGVCDDYKGSGRLGVIKPSLDALLEIVRRRTPGDWRIKHGDGIGRTSGCESHHREFGSSTVVFNHAHELTDQDAAAIVAAVNNFEAVAERCKQAEDRIKDAENERDARRSRKIQCENNDVLIAELTSQRNELLAACELADQMRRQIAGAPGNLCWNRVWKAIQSGLASVKGGADEA